MSHEGDFEITISLSIHSVQILLAKDEIATPTEASPIAIYSYHLLVLFITMSLITRTKSFVNCVLIHVSILQDKLLFSTASRPNLGLTQLSIFLVPRIRRPAHEAHHSLLTSAENKNM
jgi:hypothetical protein